MSSPSSASTEARSASTRTSSGTSEVAASVLELPVRERLEELPEEPPEELLSDEPSFALPRNCTLSATISTADLLLPPSVSHSRQSRRPSIATERALFRDWGGFSPCFAP